MRHIHPRRHLRLPLTALPLRFARAAEPQLELWEQGLAVSILAVAGPLAHHEVQGGPSPPLRRLARALLASCLTMARCALAPVRRVVHCHLLRNRRQALKRRSRIPEPLGGEFLERDTRLAQKCACPR